MKSNLKGYARTIMAMVEAGEGEVFVANREEKPACVSLEKRGLIHIRRTEERCDGMRVWYVRKA